MVGFLGAKALSQLIGAVSKDTPNIQTYKPAMQGGIKRYGIIHKIPHKRYTIDAIEHVLMDLLAIWTTQLFIHENVRRLPDADTRSPLDRQAANQQFVIDQCSILRFNRCGCEDFEM